jgi:ElaB/YqjD/DUF883 family membrane-anchored ribosome-binding protein
MHHKTSYQGMDGVEKNVRKNQKHTRGRCIIMANADQMVNAGVASADHLKIQTAEAFEDAARKLRRADVSAKGEEVKNILHDIEHRVNLFKEEVGVECHKIEAGYNKTVEPVENVIIDHPIPSVLVAAAIGALIGMLLFKGRD